MLSTHLLQLFILLPLLISASSHRSPLDARLSSRSSRRAAHVARALTLEERLAKRASGKVLARGSAAKETCRTKGASFSASATSRSASASGSASISGSASASASASVTSSASGAASTTASSSTSTADAAQSSAAASAAADYGAQNWAQPASSSAAAAAQSSAAATSNIATAGFTPNGIKAGLSAGDAYDYVKDHIGWWYDWTPDPSGHWGSPVAVPMLWGAGTMDGTDASRLTEFKALSSTPSYIIGPEEPDCSTYGSAGFDVATGVALWDSLMAPKGASGSVLLSPSMCKQAAESGWLGPFSQQISRQWDITNVHINKNSADGIKSVIVSFCLLLASNS